LLAKCSLWPRRLRKYVALTCIYTPATFLCAMCKKTVPFHRGEVYVEY
jgi:hypothetical protein